MMAEMVIDILNEHGIHYCAVCSDNADSGKRGIENCFGWDEINSRYDEFSVIIAHAPNPKRMEELKKNERIRRIFFIHSYDIKLFDADVVAKHKDEYAQVCDLLQDMYSKDCITAYLNTKMTGDMQYILDIFKREMNCFENSAWYITENESFWDIGAYTGNLIQSFMTVSQGKYHQIVAMEPDK